MEQKNGVQQTLAKNGIMFKIDEVQAGLPEIISEETFIELLTISDEDSMPQSIEDEGYENDDLDDDGLMIMWTELDLRQLYSIEWNIF